MNSILQLHKLIGGGSSSAGWTVNISIGNTEPTSAENYDMWIKSDFEKNNLYFQSTEPDSPLLNDIWVKIGDMKYSFDISEGAKLTNNAIKELVVTVSNSTVGALTEGYCKIWQNSIQKLYAYLGAVRVWNGSEWIFVESYYYYDSKWNNFSQADFKIFGIYDSGIYIVNPDGTASEKKASLATNVTWKECMVFKKNLCIREATMYTVAIYNHESGSIKNTSFAFGDVSSSTPFNGLAWANDSENVYVANVRQKSSTYYVYISKLDNNFECITTKQLYTTSSAYSVPDRGNIFFIGDYIYCCILGSGGTTYILNKSDLTLVRTVSKSILGVKGDNLLVYNSDTTLDICNKNMEVIESITFSNNVLRYTTTIKCDKEGNYYILYGSTLYKFNSSGELINSVNSVSDYIFTNDWYIWLTTTNATLKKYDKDLNYLFTASLPASLIANINGTYEENPELF